MAAASKDVTGTSEGGLSKWQIGLLIGAPTVIVLGGIWYYKRNQRKNKKARDDRSLGDGSENDVSFDSSPSPTKPVQEQEELPPHEKALAHKNKGNKYFKGGKYDQAIGCYTDAINTCPEDKTADLATFYHNRAAAYEKLKNFKMVVDDCTTAITYNNKYVKALTRRAQACEQLGNLTQALEDVTALCILEGFQNRASLEMADRVLKRLGSEKAQKAFQNRVPTMPSRPYARMYFVSFVNDPILNEVKRLKAQRKNDSQLPNGDSDVPAKSPYETALWNMTTEHYDEVVDLCGKELDIPDSVHAIEARLLRATFYLLSNQYEEAMVDLKAVLVEDSIDKKMKVNALIKRGTMLIQIEKQTEGLADLASAVRIDPDNADIYHHRGHHNIQLGRIEDAIRDLENAISKCPSFAASHVQKSFAEHRKAADQMMQMNLPLPQSVLQSYKANVEMFPEYGDARALYAQALGDVGKVEEAHKQYDRAIELEPDNATHMVHKGMLLLQAEKDMKGALDLLHKALEVDDKCEYAYEVLGTIEVQQGDMDKAMAHYKKAVAYSRTESEMAHLYSLIEAAQAQLNVAKNLGIKIPNPLGGQPL